MDALANYFARKYPDNFITGTDDCHLLIIKKGGDDDLKNALFVIAVGAFYEPLHIDIYSLHDYVNGRLKSDPRLRNMYAWAKDIRKTYGINTQLIVYPKIPDYEENNWNGSERSYPPEQVMFYIYGNGTDSRPVSGETLMKNIHNYIGYKGEIGCIKKVNCKVATYLQYWDRAYLGKGIQVTDLDGVFYNKKTGKSILLEIKRSNSKGKNGYWSPYTSDYNNYRLYDTIAKKIEAGFLVIKHCSDEKNQFTLLEDHHTADLYDVCGINEKEYKNLINNGIFSGEYLDTNVINRNATLGNICDHIKRMMDENVYSSSSSSSFDVRFFGAA